MNWGNKLLIAFILFASGIGYLVYRSMHVQTDLVVKDYYKNELRYQEVIDGSNRANALSSRIRIQQDDQVIIMQMPAEMTDKKLDGDIWFYCAADASKDKRVSMNFNDQGIQQVHLNNLLPGIYTVKFNWKTGEHSYYSEEQLTIL